MTRMNRRHFLHGSAAVAATSAWNLTPRRALAAETSWDFVIVGAGTAGLPAAIFASRRGARVLLVDAAHEIGGNLHLANGQISAGGTKLQHSLGIVDTPRVHYDDIMRISKGSADPDMVRLAVNNATATVDWLIDAGLKPLAGHPIIGEMPGRPAYSRRRYLWGEHEGRDILAVVNHELAPEIASGRVVTQLATEVTSLITNDHGDVEGVRASSGDREFIFRGRHVLLTTGGYASNPEMFKRLCGYNNYVAASYPFAKGQGIDLAVSVGGYVHGREQYRGGFGSILADERYPTKVMARFITVPQERPPWEIWVNANGERFIREDEPLVFARERALLHQADMRYWIVFDQAIFETAPPGVRGWTRERMAAAFGTHPYFKRADTVEDLARQCELDATTLLSTVAAYNAAVSNRRDPLGRQYLPHAIASAPFYAVRHQGHSASSAAGVAVDKALRVVRGGGEPIRNLYAAGELLGSGVMMGNAFCGGMLLTPALAFGRLLGSTLAV